MIIVISWNEIMSSMTRCMIIIKTRITNILCLCSSIVCVDKIIYINIKATRIRWEKKRKKKSYDSSYMLIAHFYQSNPQIGPHTLSTPIVPLRIFFLKIWKSVEIKDSVCGILDPGPHLKWSLGLSSCSWSNLTTQQAYCPLL